MCTNVRGALGLPTDTPLPAFPLDPSYAKSITKMISDKLKPPDSSADAMQVDVDGVGSDPQKRAAKFLASYLPVFSANPEELMMPPMPSRTEMESILLELRKKALVGEYFGEE